MQINSTSMMAHSNYITNSANNVANVNTPDFSATSTTLQNPSEGNIQAVSSSTNSSTSLAKEFTDEIEVQRGFEANAEAIKTADKMIGSLIDLSI